MMKRLTAALAAAMMLASVPAHAAGTTPLSLAQQVDINGAPLANCQLYFFVAGTPASPQNAYADFGLTQALPNPLACDQTGRVPQHWIADGLIHIRLTDSSGVSIIDATLQSLGPSSGGGGGGSTVDPTTVLATGDEKIRYGTGPLAGFVRENGLTIGNATSGATERANADTQSLWIYLYNIDPNLAVSGGRTGNALNDFNANKTIALPDMRGMVNAFLDDMGNSAAGRLTSTFLGCAATTLGCGGGSQSYTMLTTNLPPYTPAGSVSSSLVNGGNTIYGFLQPGSNVGVGGTATGGAVAQITSFLSVSSIFTGTAQGGTSAPFGTLPPMRLKTLYIKL